MNNKNTGIIATIASVVLCGCPGLFLLLFGAISAFGGGTFSLGDQSGGIPPTVGFVLVCLALIFILIPVAVGFFMLRRKPTATIITPPSGPIPPAS
ncbi:MAG: hypothetical protein HYR93_02910 [Chloroflexi bacterium]|nr:hypothetical protein [Chloroflexota bacterium]